jgi:hypothetical protein
LHKLYKSSNDISVYNAYSFIRKEFKILNRFLYANYIIEIESDMDKNPKKFFKYINSKKETSGFPRTMLLDNITLNDNISICNAFAKFFSSVYERNYDINNDGANDDVDYSASPFLLLSFDQDDLLSELSNLDCNKGAGPDGFPPCIFKNCSLSLALPLSLLFNKSIRSGIVPSVWKNSFIKPIFKSGDRSNITNYRGVAVLSIVPKLLEFMIKKKLDPLTRNIVAAQQHGFIEKRSTITNLMCLSKHVFNAFTNDNHIDVIYTDFSKAFDKVNQSILLLSLNNLNKEWLPIKWLASYLRNRQQFVKIGNYSSNSFTVTSGVPQGSHLGPILFILFINDVVEQLRHCEVLIYADDIKLFMEIKSSDDNNYLQNDLNNFLAWCRSKKLYLNLSKCCTISFCRKKPSSLPTYYFDNCSINRVRSVNDLGIVLSDHFSFDKHIDLIVRRAKIMSGFIYRNARDFRDPITLLRLYSALVRPILEYGAVLWSPYQQNQAKRIESVQKNFLKYTFRLLPSIGRADSYVLAPYADRLRLAGLQPLYHRRTVAGALFIRDLICNRVDCQFLLALCNMCVPSRQLRPRSQFLMTPLRRRNYSMNEPFLLCVKYFNDYFFSLIFIFHVICSKLVFCQSFYNLFVV